MITFRCYRCKTEVHVAPDEAGKSTRCPKCNTKQDAPGTPRDVGSTLSTASAARATEKAEVQRPKKMGLIGWALSGGVFFSDVPGRTAGTIGAAVLGTAALKLWPVMTTEHDPEIRSRLLPFFLLSGLMGVGLLTFGYYQYLTQDDSDQNQNSTENQPQQTPAANAGPMSKVLGYAGFGIGMIFMIAFIPPSKDHHIPNAMIGAVVGAIVGGLGSWLGGLLDRQGK